MREYSMNPTLWIPERLVGNDYSTQFESGRGVLIVVLRVGLLFLACLLLGSCKRGVGREPERDTIVLFSGSFEEFLGLFHLFNQGL